jgi:hypothetical protein
MMETLINAQSPYPLHTGVIYKSDIWTLKWAGLPPSKTLETIRKVRELQMQSIRDLWKNRLEKSPEWRKNNTQQTPTRNPHTEPYRSREIMHQTTLEQFGTYTTKTNNTSNKKRTLKPPTTEPQQRNIQEWTTPRTTQNRQKNTAEQTEKNQRKSNNRYTPLTEEITDIAEQDTNICATCKEGGTLTQCFICNKKHHKQCHKWHNTLTGKKCNQCEIKQIVETKGKNKKRKLKERERTRKTQQKNQTNKINNNRSPPETVNTNKKQKKNNQETKEPNQHNNKEQTENTKTMNRQQQQRQAELRQWAAQRDSHTTRKRKSTAQRSETNNKKSAEHCITQPNNKRPRK